MYHLSDKDIDRLSKEAAEQYDVEQSTAGWEQLEEKLNKTLPQKEDRRRRFLFLLLLFVFLSGAGLVWVLTNNPEKNPLTQNTNTTENSTTPTEDKTRLNSVDDSKTIIPGSNQPAKNAPATNKAPAITEPDKTVRTKNNSTVLITPPSDLQNKNTASLNRNSQKTKNVLSREKQQTTKNPNEIIISEKQKNNNNVSRSSIVINDDPKIISDLYKQSTTKTQDAVANQQQNTNAGQQQNADNSKTVNPPVGNATSSDADKNKEEDVKNKTTVDKPAAKTKKEKAGKQRLEIGLVVAPDFSNVKFANGSTIGINGGLQIGYRLSNRWLLNTGLLYTKKNYDARGKDFNPPKHYWTRYYNIKKIEGSCSMLDIPLNIRYDFSVNKSRRFFISTGASTYLMDKENYDYYYKLNNGRDTVRAWASNNNSNYWFSIINFSAGFEKTLNRHFSLQVEPYIKIPAAGVGFGKMQLNSYGIYFSLKYKPVFGSQKTTALSK